MLISNQYIEQNKLLHKQRKDYGSRFRLKRWADVFSYCEHDEMVLDYGCGKGAMRKHYGSHKVTNYDPATFPEQPNPHPVVACLDVMEHVEPDCLDVVLSHIHGLTQRVAYFVICKSLGSKVLPDGRPAHLIVENSDWWQAKLSKHFSVVEFIETELNGRHDMTFICSHL